jgi:hypothetical protein
MALQTMFQAKSNSPQTTLTAIIAADATSLTVFDGSVLPPGPNLLTLGTDEDAEVVYYSTINGNVVSGLVRGYSGTTASVWEEGTQVSREFTSYDHDTFKANIESLQDDVDDLNTAMAGKQDELTFDTTPTASSTNPVTSGGIKTYVDSHDDFKVTGTVSASGYTLTDSRINNEHWEVDWIYFATPSNVASQIHWTTNITTNTVSLSATYTGATNVIVNMHWVQ